MNYLDADIAAKGSRAWGPAIAVAVLVCFLLTITGTLAVRNWEEQDWENEFVQFARERDYSFQLALEQRVELLESVAAHYEGSGGTRGFLGFVRSMLQKHAEFDAIGWMEHVPNTVRDSYTNRMQTLGWKDFQIQELNEAGEFEKAPQRDEYFPITFLEPRDKFAEWIGFSATNPDKSFFNALLDAKQWREATATGLQPLLGPVDEPGVFILRPIFEVTGEQTPGANLGVPMELRGYIFIRLNMHKLVAQAFDHGMSSEAHVVASLFDVTSAANVRLLHSTLMAQNAKLDFQITPQDLRQPPFWEKQISFANRQWVLITTPTLAFARQKNRWISGLVFTVGLVLTAFLYAFLAGQAHHTREIEDRVAQRTKQLSKANAMLGQNVAEKESANSALMESESRYRALAENSTDIISRHDLEGICLYSSAAVRSQLGYEPKDVCGRSVYPLFHKDDVARIKQAHTRIIREPVVETVTYRARHASGHFLWFEASCHCIRDMETGEPREIQSIARDVSGRRKAEESLRENEERFRSAFEDAAVGMAIISPDGQFVRVNHSLCDMVGYPRQELLATDIHSITHPADIEKSLTSLSSILEGDERSFNIEKRYIHKDGKVIWGRLSASAVRDSEGNPLYFVAQIQDVTDRKHGEETILELTLRQYVMAEMFDDALFIVSPDAHLAFANHAFSRLFGYEHQELIGQSVKQILSWVGVDEETDAALSAALRVGSGSEQVRQQARHKSGEKMTLNCRIESVRQKDTIYGAIITCRLEK